MSASRMQYSSLFLHSLSCFDSFSFSLSGLDRLARYPHLMQSIFPNSSLRPPPVPGTPDYPLRTEVPYYPEIPFGSETRIETRPADSRALVNEMIAKTAVAFRSSEYDSEDIGPVRTPSGMSTPSTARVTSSSSSSSSSSTGIFNHLWSGSGPGSMALQEISSPPRVMKASQRYYYLRSWGISGIQEIPDIYTVGEFIYMKKYSAI